ncbi:MAG: hypothetical protein GY832_32275 [Chloroflexi bacterium]|nr:hypothetical protein [Chloroflexota bacterium]
MASSQNNIPVIGTDINWHSVGRQNKSGGLRLVGFDPLVSVDVPHREVKIGRPARGKPYAVATLELVETNTLYQLLVTRKSDFRRLWEAAGQRDYCDNTADLDEILETRAKRWEDLSLGTRSEFKRLHSELFPSSGLEVIVVFSSLLEPYGKSFSAWVCWEGVHERMISNDWGGESGLRQHLLCQPIFDFPPED